MQRCSIWTVSLAAALSLTGAAWAEHGEGGHSGSHGATPTFATQRESHESHSGAQNSGMHSAAASNFAARLANNPTLSARLLALMTPGISTTADLMNAAKGFRNQGQFIAALHAAKDLNIKFTDLKNEMTGSDHDSLGQAIHDLRPDLDTQTLKADVTLARQQEKSDLQAARAAKEAAEDAKEAAKEAAKDAKEAAKEKAEDAKEAARDAAEDAKEAAEEANEAAKTPTSTTTTGTTTTGSSTTGTSPTSRP